MYNANDVRYVIQMFGINDEHAIETIFSYAMHVWVARNKNGENKGYAFVEFRTQHDLLNGLNYVHNHMPGVRASMVVPPPEGD